MRQISRDPFARETLMRDSVKTFASCSFCGSTRRDSRLYQYITQRDAVYVHAQDNVHKGLFCSKSCHDAYHSN
jgi:hypothetical protein